MFSRPFPNDKNSLKIEHLKSINFFLVFEYGNLTSIKTHRDRLRNLGKALLNRKFRFLGSERDWGSHKGFRCFLVVDLSFFCWLSPWVFKNFLVFALDYPFWVFTLGSCSFFSFSFFLTVLLCTWQFKIYPEQVKDLSRWFWQKNSQGKTSSI